MQDAKCDFQFASKIWPFKTALAERTQGKIARESQFFASNVIRAALNLCNSRWKMLERLSSPLHTITAATDVKARVSRRLSFLKEISEKMSSIWPCIAPDTLLAEMQPVPESLRIQAMGVTSGSA